jgi:integrase
MATVRKREWGDGKQAWILTYTDDNGKRRKRRQETFHSKKAADTRRREVEHGLDMGTHTAKGDSILFRDAAKAFLMDCQRRHRIGDMTANGLRHYLYKLDHYAVPRLGARRLSELRKLDFQKFVDELREHLAPRTVHGIYGGVYACLTFAVGQGWLKRNILRDDPIKLPHISKRKKVPSLADIQTLINAAERQAFSENLLTFLNRRVCVHLGIFGGLRPGEWFGLQWEDIDFAQNVLHISHTFNEFDGLKGPKSEAGRRDVDITPSIFTALSDVATYWTLYDRMREPGWRSYDRKAISLRIQDAWARRQDKQIDIPVRTGFVILSRIGTPMRPTTATRFWGDLMKKAGLQQEGRNNFTAHALRHANASLQIKAGVPLPAVSRSLGHSRASTTLDCYAHVLRGDDTARTAMERVSQEFAPQLLPPPDMPSDKRERKLTEDQARAIKARIANNDPLTRIAKDMKISLSSVYSIKSGRNWGWLP